MSTEGVLKAYEAINITIYIIRQCFYHLCYLLQFINQFKHQRSTAPEIEVYPGVPTGGP